MIGAVLKYARWNALCQANRSRNTLGCILTRILASIAAHAFRNARSLPFSREDEVPAAYTAKGGEYISKVGLAGHFEGTNHHGNHIVLETVKQLNAGEVVNLRDDIQPNYDFFKSGPGYGAKDQDPGN